MNEDYNSIENINRNPFKFLDSYTKEDRDIFFGRETELEVIYRKFYKSKILLVYGKSGTGKSSIINCGLVSKIPSEDVLVIPVRCGKDPVNNLKSDLLKFTQQQASSNENQPQQNNIIDILEDIYLENFKPITLIFDQFEEIFILSTAEERKELVGELLKIIKSKLRINLIIIFREEYFASFSEFENDIPNLFENRVRVEKLNRMQVKEIIEKPCKICNVGIEPGMADKISGLLSHETGTIELTYFQILIDRLYKIAAERSIEQPVLKVEDLSDIGDIGNLLGDFLNSQLLDMENASDVEAVLKSMISEDGTKKRVLPEEIADSLKKSDINISVNQIKNILQDLINRRIVSEKDEQGFYEIKHDSLAQRIYERLTADERKLKEIQLLLKNAFKQYQHVGTLISERTLRYVEPYEEKLAISPDLVDYIDKSKQTIVKQKRRKRNVAVGLVSFAIVVLLGFTLWNIIERKKAVNQTEIAIQKEKESRANELAVHSISQLEINPTLSFRLAEEAYKVNPEGITAYKALLNSYYSEPFYSILYEGNQRLISAVLTNDFKTLLYTGTGDGIVYNLSLISGSKYLHTGHNNTIKCLSLSTDSKLFLSGDYDGMVGIGSIHDTTYEILKVSKDEINSLLLGRLNKRIVIASGERANVFSLNGGKLKEFQFKDKVFCSNSSIDNFLVFHGKQNRSYRAGKSFLSELDKNGNIVSRKNWNLSNYITSANFFNNNKNIVICPGYDILNPRVYDLNENRLYDLKGTKYDIKHVTFSDSGKFAIGATDGGQVFIWDLFNKLPKRFNISGKRINSIKYHRNGSSFLISCDDSTAKLVSITGDIIHEFKGHKAEVKDAKFSSDFERVLTSSLDGTSNIYSINGSLLETISDKYNNSVHAATFNPDGKSITTICPDWRINFFDSTGLNTGDLRWRVQVLMLTGYKGIEGSWYSRTAIYDTLGNLLDVFSWHNSHVNSADVSNNKKYIVTASNDSTAKLWDYSGNELQVFRGHNAPVRFATFSYDSKMVLTTGWDNTIRIWDLEGKELRSISVPENEKPIYAVFTENDEFICAESYKNKLLIYDINGELLEYRRMWTPIKVSPFVSSIEYSKDGNNFLTATSIYGSVNIFDIDGTRIKKMLGNFAMYSPNGQYILTTNEDTKAYLYDSNGSLIKQFVGHQRSLNKASFSNSGNFIATTSNDFTTRIWDLEGNEIIVFEHDTVVMDAAFSPDDKYLTTVCSDGTITIWLIDPQLIIDKVNLDVNRGLTWHLDANTKKKYGLPFTDYDKLINRIDSVSELMFLLPDSNQIFELPILYAEMVSKLLDTNEFQITNIERIKIISDALSKMNRYSRGFQERTNDSLSLAKSVKWMQKTLTWKKEPNTLDIYARILYKSGKIKEAIKVQEQTIALQKRMGGSTTDMERFLNKIKEEAVLQ